MLQRRATARREVPTNAQTRYFGDWVAGGCDAGGTDGRLCQRTRAAWRYQLHRHAFAGCYERKRAGCSGFKERGAGCARIRDRRLDQFRTADR